MTICIATDGFTPGTGGIATFNRHLALLLTTAGHRVIILFADYEAQPGEADTISNEGLLTVVRLKKSYQQHYSSWRSYFKPGGMNAASWIATGMAMRDWLLANHASLHIDITEVSDYGGAGIFLCDPQLPPVVVTGHGSLEQLSHFQYDPQDEHFRVIRKLETLSYQHANAIIAHSPHNRNLLMQGFNREVYLAPMPWTASPEEEQAKVVPGKCVVVGGLQPVKGIHQMIDATRLLSEKKAVHFQVSWVGPDTWLAPGYKKMSAYLSDKNADVWGKNFNWLGALDSRSTLIEISSSEMVVIPSFFDTFGYVALEAAMIGKAIIITAGTGASYLFTHGVDAWIIPSNDPAMIAEAIAHLEDQTQLRMQLGTHARINIAARLGGENLIAERVAIYTEVIAKRGMRSVSINPVLTLLKSYRNPFRKYYYCIRSELKKLFVKGGH